jgi:hypothetical protein
MQKSIRNSNEAESWRDWEPEKKLAFLRRLQQRNDQAAAERPIFVSPEQLTFADLKIRTKDKRMIAFEPNLLQRLYLDILTPDWRTGDYRMSGKREMLLKFRQPGFSTLILALLFLDTITTPNTYTVVVAHEADSTERLFRIVQRFYDHLPEEKKPKTQYANRREYLWPALDSSFFVGTAGSKDFGRSATINNVHLSEAASYPNADDLISGLLQAVPADGNVFVESTAKGQGNWFHEEYTAAERGDSVYHPRFYGWHQHSEYRDDELPGAFRPTEEERKLQQRFNLDPGQLNWRREKVKELKAEFPQEYPLSPGEAFLATGGRVLSEFVEEPEPAGHIVADFSPAPPRSWRHLLIIDPGWRITAGLWAAVDPEDTVWLYGEYYEGEARKTPRLPREHLESLNEQWKTFGKPAVEVLMDPAGFDLKRTTTGREAPSDAEEYREAAREMGIAWFDPHPADNSDGMAYRVKRRFSQMVMFVCQSLVWWRWEAKRWTRKAPLSGRAAAERRDPDQPIDRNNHLMDTTRYLCNELESGTNAGFVLVGKGLPS